MNWLPRVGCSPTLSTGKSCRGDRVKEDIGYYNQLAKAALTDDAAFTELYRSFFTPVYNFVYARLRNAADADEVTADVFCHVFFHLEDYSGSSSYTAWMFRVARNAVIDFVRKRDKKRQIQTEGWEEYLTAASPKAMEPEEVMVSKEDIAELLAKVDMLKEPARQAVQLKYWSNLSNVQIAEILGTTSDHVGVIIYRALRMLRKS